MIVLGLLIITDILGMHQITDNEVLSVSLEILWGTIITISSYAIIHYNKFKYLQISKEIGSK